MQYRLSLNYGPETTGTEDLSHSQYIENKLIKFITNFKLEVKEFIFCEHIVQVNTRELFISSSESCVCPGGMT